METLDVFAKKQQVTSFLLPVSEALNSMKSVTINGAETNINLLDPIVFQFLPEISGDDNSANYTEPGGTGLGRAESLNVYRSSSNREFQLTTNFAATGSAFATDKDNNQDEFWVQRQVYKLKALTQPIYDRDTITQGTGTFYGPPMVLFTYGLRYVNVPVIITSVSATPNADAMITSNSAYPQVMGITINMKTSYPYGYVPGYLNYIKQFGGKGNASNQMDSGLQVENILTDGQTSDNTSIPDNRRGQNPTGVPIESGSRIIS
jgi:hypothetical protein